jgi:two-component system LytT family response regulator
MIRAYLVDDEPLAVERLARLLAATGRVQVAGSAIEPAAAVEHLRGHTVDVLFLDIHMPELTGFDLLAQLDSPPLVVFTTAYDEHALAAFEANSVDYLLKPVDPQRLARAVDKVELMLAGGRNATGADVQALARELLAQLATGRAADRIPSHAGDRILLLDLTRITHFVAHDKLTFAVVNGREHVVDRSLAELEETLDSRRFLRVHRSTIVNIAAIQEIDRLADDRVMVRIKDEKRTELPVARERVKELRRRLGLDRVS